MMNKVKCHSQTTLSGHIQTCLLMIKEQDDEISISASLFEYHIRKMSGNNAMLADEILGKYGDVSNLNIDFLIKDDSDGDNVELVRPSLYYEMTSLPRDLGQNLHRFNILSLNAQSLRAKYDKLTIFIELARQQNIRFHAICIQETWMDSNADFHK